MPIIEIHMQIVVDENGQLAETPIIPVPNQPHPVMLIWTIVGGAFDPDDGIVLNSGPTSAISSLHGNELQWSAVDTNNSETSGHTITYSINYVADLTLAKLRRDDPVIDNQPPPGS